jgi:hypothetical protein
VAGILGAALVSACFAGLIIRDVYSGIPPAVPVSALSATCDDGSAPASCTATVVKLNPGRFRVATSTAASRVTLQVDDPAAAATPRFLLARSATAGQLLAAGATAPQDGPTAIGELSKPNVRHVFELPRGSRAWNRIVFAPARTAGPVVIDEIGFFADRTGLLRSALQPFQRISVQGFYLSGVVFVMLGICVFMVIAAHFLPARPSTLLAPPITALLCFAFGILEVGTIFSPYWSRDVRSFYASEWLPFGPDSNLTGGLYEGSRIVQGLGETVRDGVVQWHRMPGYGLFCAFAAFIGRTTDVIEIAALVVVLQAVLYAAAAGVFVWAAQRVFTPWIAWLLGVLVAMLPKQLAYTQSDSIVVPIQLLVLSALLVYVAAERDGRATLRHFLWVNLAFALWFFMRNDVMPGWIVVTAVLAAGRWRRLALPIVLMITIAVPWAAYKRRYLHEFALLPTNTGEVLLLSLCEVPGAFPYPCTDVGYAAWARRAGHADVTTGRASTHAATEVVRHWVTYPVHFGFMVLSKARASVTTQSFPGFQTRFNRLFGLAGDTWIFVGLLTVMAAALAVNYQRRRTLLLGWAVFLNMPIFFVTFASSGRFYAAAGVSLVAAAVPLVCERDYYRALARHPWRVAVVVACVTAFLGGGPRLEQLVVTHDALHYWAPLVDPGQSTLRFTGR